MSDQAIRTVTIAEAKRRVEVCFNHKQPVFLWGGAGVGKSQVIASIAKELDAALYDLRLGQLDPTDLRGMPFFNKEIGRMDWAPPVDLPSEAEAAQHKYIVLFLDEMNQASPAVQGAAYQLILDRRVGQYKLPDNVLIVAAGNRESDKGVSYRMPSPLVNRMTHLEIKVDFESWLEWAANNGQHPDVIGYLTFAKQDLFNFDSKSASRAFATPRSWSFVSEFAHDKTLSKAELADLIAGSVGDGTAVKYMAHREMAGAMPIPSDILEGKNVNAEFTDSNVSAQYALSASLCYELREAYDALTSGKLDESGKAVVTEQKYQEYCNNFYGFMLDHFSTEMAIVAARMAIKNYKLKFDSGKMPNFKRFHQEYGALIIAANSTK